VKITGARTTLVHPRAGSRESRCIVELQTDAGAIGVAIGAASIHQNARRVVEELLLDADPRAVTMLWQKLSEANARSEGSLGPTIAALDIALWDLKAKLNDEPLWRTLGGLRPRVNMHMRVSTSVDDAALDTWCRAAAPSSIRGVVLTSSGNAESDARRLSRVRDALANPAYDCELMLDADERWSAKDAIRAVVEIERAVDLAWVEAPIARGDFLGHKRVGDSIRGAVCAGGKLSAASEFLPHLHHHSINIVQLDIARTGITASLQIADAAYAYELPIALTRSPGNIHAHIGAVLPYVASMEYDDDTSVGSDIRLENGWTIAGDRLGHGLMFDRGR
jgi:L-alanine-DL-glutamate epimerase-like enolase superfamily enzyme